MILASLTAFKNNRNGIDMDGRYCLWKGRKESLHFYLEYSIRKPNSLCRQNAYSGCNKISGLRTKYINRKLDINRIASNMFKFDDVIVVIMSIDDVEMLYFDQNSHRHHIVDMGM